MKWMSKVIFFSIVTLTACQSRPFPGLVALKNWTDLPRTFSTWQAQCLGQLGEGSFLSTLRTTQVPELMFEGRWSVRFERFQGRVASPLNQTLVNLELSAREQTVSLSPDLNQMQPEAAESIKKSAQALAVLGPQGLRKMMCGITGFSEPGAKVFVSEVSTPVKQFGFLNQISFEGHRIDITARYELEKEQAKANINLKAPVVVQKPELRIVWQGRVQPLKPNKIEVSGKDVTVSLFFEEFE